MKQFLKDFWGVFSKYHLPFIFGVLVLEAIDFAHYLMNYPSDITFYLGFLIYMGCIGVIGYGINSIYSNLKGKKNEN
jgi:hypothetical protein